MASQCGTPKPSEGNFVSGGVVLPQTGLLSVNQNYSQKHLGIMEVITSFLFVPSALFLRLCVSSCPKKSPSS